HASHTVCDLQRERKPLTQRSEVCVANLEVELALPSIELGKRAPNHVTTQVDWRGHFQRRNRAQTEAMAREQFVEAKRAVLEHQRFPSQRLVPPGEIRVAQHDPALLQQPIGETALTLIVLCELE